MKTTISIRDDGTATVVFPSGVKKELVNVILRLEQPIKEVDSKDGWRMLKPANKNLKITIRGTFK